MQTTLKPRIRPVPKPQANSEALKVKLKLAKQRFEHHSRLAKLAKDERDQLLTKLLEDVDVNDLADLSEVQI
jgi:hypothetical protein